MILVYQLSIYTTLFSILEKYFDALQANDGNRAIDPTEAEDKKTFLSDNKHLEKQVHRVNRVVSNFTVETYMEEGIIPMKLY